jgi:hypothetical protein
MDQKNALNGQEAVPDNKPPITSQPQEQSVEKQSSMETLLKEEGLGLDFPKQGEDSQRRRK